MAEFIYTMTKARKAVGDKLILDDVTMSFFPTAKIGVVGPNGAGKSTILRIMAGLDQPSNGEARLSPGYTVGILLQEPPLKESKRFFRTIEVRIQPRIVAEPDDSAKQRHPGAIFRVDPGLRRPGQGPA